MNVDVREYLRINPISVHELTLSGDAKDCFLYFPANSSTNDTGYEVYTQKTMFWSICQSIFRNLVVGNENGFGFDATVTWNANGTPIVTWADVHLTDDQFTDYVRRHKCTGSSWPDEYIWKTFRDTFAANLTTIRTSLDDRILALKKQAKLNYIGSVEPQSRMKKTTNKFIANGDIYDGHEFSKDCIWCYKSGAKNPDGADHVVIGDKPRSHHHRETSAETLTFPFAMSFGGGKLIGKYSIGNKVVVSETDSNSVTTGMQFETMKSGVDYSDPEDNKLTYPLYGENVLDYRNRRRSHNNVPPVTNIHIRYWEYNETHASDQKDSETDMATYRSVYGQLEENVRDALALVTETPNASEAVYESDLVPHLESFISKDLTDSDLLLRMTLDGDVQGGVKIRKQAIQMLLDIFVDIMEKSLEKYEKYDADKKFSDYVYVESLGREMKNIKNLATIAQILKPILDVELVPINEFMSWYNTKMLEMQEIEAKLEELASIIKSQKPMVYAGRIIMSVTDDTEKKVIEHYGGARWRRIPNFLRGVEKDDLAFGEKAGEEYVCLRQSNVPIHTHDVSVKGTTTTSGIKQMQAFVGGQETKVVNFQSSSDEDNRRNSYNMRNRKGDYQISPLEHQVESRITYPHDNMPPYKEVYIWECIDTTPYEKTISGEPETQKWKVEWDSNGGSPVIPDWEIIDGEPLSSYQNSIPTVAKTNYNFTGWYSGTIEAKPTTVITRNTRFTARWAAQDVNIHFHANGGRFSDGTTEKTLTYKYGDNIGTLMNVTYSSQDSDWQSSTDFNGWYTEPNGGEQILSSTVVTCEMDCYALWDRYIHYTNVSGVNIDENEVASGFDTSHNHIVFAGENQKLDFSKNWELVIKVKTGSDVSANQEIFGTDGGADMEFGVIRDIHGVNRFGWELITRWNGGTDGGIPGTVVEVMPTTEYIVKVRHTPVSSTSHHFDCYVLDNTTHEWILDKSGTRNSVSYQRVNFVLGVDMDNSIEYWRGSIYLRESYIIVEGVKYNFRKKTTATITFNGNGNGQTETREVQVGYPLGSFPSFSRNHYTLNGWWTAASGGGQIYESEIVTGDATYYAHWTVDTHTIIWNPMNGSVAFTTTQGYDTNLSLPTQPTYAGNNFHGWFTDPTDGAQVTGSTKVTADATYYVHWQSDTCTVTFNANGGSVQPSTSSTMSVAYGSMLGSTIPTASRSGYTFVAWCINADGMGDYLYPATPILGNVTYYAKWEPVEYTLTFDSTGGLPSSFTRKKKYNEEIETLPSPTKDGSSLQGWFTSASGGTQIQATTKYTVAANSTYYAHWDTSYNIYFTVNAGSETYPYNNPTWATGGGNATKSYIKKNGEKYPNPGTVTDPGYTFNGWKINNEGSVIAPSAIASRTISVTGDTTVFAQYTAKKFNITLCLNNTRAKWTDNNGTENRTVQATYGQTYPAFPAKSATGYNFDKWVNASGGATINTSGDFTHTSPITVNATWNIITYSIKYNANNHGTVPSTYKSAYTVEESYTPPNLPDLEDEGWDFNGWSPSGITTGTTGEITFTANWKRKTHTVRFYSEGVLKHTCTVEHGQTLGGTLGAMPPTPTRSGYTFAGWSRFAETPSMFAADVPVEVDLNLYAMWKGQITITFDSNGGS